MTREQLTAFELRLGPTNLRALRARFTDKPWFFKHTDLLTELYGTVELMLGTNYSNAALEQAIAISLLAKPHKAIEALPQQFTFLQLDWFGRYLMFRLGGKSEEVARNEALGDMSRRLNKVAHELITWSD